MNLLQICYEYDYGVNMASMKDKLQCALWFYNTRSAITVDTILEKNVGETFPTGVECVKNCCKKLKDTGSVSDQISWIRLCSSNERSFFEAY